ncbi:MAG: BT4734/BF3469 family protein [Fulvivirga sp.]
MEVSREAILHKTHYGLNIYAYVLRKYYQGETVLSLSGRDCKPTKNPFNSNKPTLIVKVVDGCASHTDTEEAIAPGNIFDFASLHFGLSGRDLNEKLNEELHLRIGQKNSFYNQEVSQPQVVVPEHVKPKAPVFSYYAKPVTNINPTREIDLVEAYSMIKGDAFATCTSTLRSIHDAKEARKYKAFQFDYVTFSGTFSKRNDKNLRKHSGLLTIDFDHVQDISGLKAELLKDQYFETELLFVSPSGDGLKWVIPIDLTKASHQDYFKAVANYIQHKYQLEIDQSGKDISRACFLPHDPQIFINPKYL